MRELSIRQLSPAGKGGIIMREKKELTLLSGVPGGALPLPAEKIEKKKESLVSSLVCCFIQLYNLIILNKYFKH